jgi:hypothetical protein
VPPQQIIVFIELCEIIANGFCIGKLRFDELIHEQLTI